MMQIGVFLVGDPKSQMYQCGLRLLDSVRATMPDIVTIHFTDMDTEPLPADGCIRKAGRTRSILEGRMEHYARADGEWLLLDADTLVCRDVRDVFADPDFDIAMSDRAWIPTKPNVKFVVTMPYNTGVVFSRTKAVYTRALAIWRAFPPKTQQWWGSEQSAIAAAVRDFRVKVLPGRIYNRPPRGADEDVSEAAILHYKGARRKPWMLVRQTTMAP